ncbi:hypothetical protein [Fischerella sp. PCC 9605]|uniref:hypothetical protein n=1 Tax=Fischerella sp. PCC 9605 TaxID=1173024 RepID=UPI00047D3C2D|nr:hypothetical protein [Fischerella sp. PCC 9605]
MINNHSMLAEVCDRQTFVKITPTGLGKAARLGSAIAPSENFRFNPPPSRQQLEALAKVVGVDADRLAQILPPGAAISCSRL